MLRYFHNVGYVHGHVEPSTIGKFQGSNNWKMMDMRRATLIGKPMGGDLRYGAPPESITCSQVKSGATEVVKLVSFDENFVRGDISTNDSDGGNEMNNNLEFNPSARQAETAWDIWSFGLIMGQLVLGQSMVLLPSFEKASDAHLRNLHQYDDAAVKVRLICIVLIIFIFSSRLYFQKFAKYIFVSHNMIRKYMMLHVECQVRMLPSSFRNCYNLGLKIDLSQWMRF